MIAAPARARAAPSLSAGEIHLSWQNPATSALGAGIKLVGVRIVRRERTYATAITDGTVVYPVPGTVPSTATFGPVITSFTDRGLRPLTTYYYTVFAVYGPDPDQLSPTYDYRTDDDSRMAGFATRDYGLAARLYQLLPAVHQRLDRPLSSVEVERLKAINPTAVAALDALPPTIRERGQLQRLMSTLGAPADLMRSLAEGLRQLRDVDIARADYLPDMAAMLGWELDQSIPVYEQRNEIKFAPRRYRTTGVVPNIRSIVTRYTKWYTQVAEVAQQIVRSNVAPQLNAFWMVPDSLGWLGADDAAPALGFSLVSSAVGTATTAAMLTGGNGPFALRPGVEIAVTADDRVPVVVRFGADDFVNIQAATVPEVVTVLNRTLSEVTASQEPPTTGPLVLRSNTIGVDSSLRVERYEASLVTLEGAPRGRLAPVNDALGFAPFGDRLRLFFETADPLAPVTAVEANQAFTRPPLPRNPVLEPAVSLPSEPQGHVRYKTFRAGSWGESLRLLPPAAGAHGEPAAAQLAATNRIWAAWVDNPNTATSRIRFSVGLPQVPTGARLVGRRGEPFHIRAGSSLVFRGRWRDRVGFEFRASDFVAPLDPDGTKAATAAEVVAALNARLVNMTASAQPSGAVAVTTTAVGGDEWLAMDLANSSAAAAIGLDTDGVASGSWGDEIIWSTPLLVPGASTPGRYAEPTTVVVPPAGGAPETVWLFWSRHDGMAWLVEGASAVFTGGLWVWSAVETVARSGMGDREPCAVVGPAGSAFVVWARRDIATRAAEDDCWTLWCRERTAAWGTENEVTRLGPGEKFADREPGVVRVANTLRVTFRSNRGGGANLFTSTVTLPLPAVVLPPVLVTPGAQGDHWPAPVLVAPSSGGPPSSLRVIYRSDRSVALSRVATTAPPLIDNHVIDPAPRRPFTPPARLSITMPDTGTARRYAGATAVDLGDAARIARHQEFDDLMSYTPERPERAQAPEEVLTGAPDDPDFKPADDIWYTRGTIALFLSPFANADPLVDEFRARLRPVLDRFLPINVRAIVRLRPRVFIEFINQVHEEFISFTLTTPFIETYTGPTDVDAMPLPFAVLHSANLSGDDVVPIDVTADVSDLTTLRRRTYFPEANEEGLMRKTEFASNDLHGMYRDVITLADGTVIDAGWKKNLILDGFRKVLASFAHGPDTAVPNSNALAIQEMRFGAGLPAWDAVAPPADPTRISLETLTFTVPRMVLGVPNPNFSMRFLQGGVVSTMETNVIEIVATLAPNEPPLPNNTLREFGLVAKLDGGDVLLNHVAHTAIIKDPTSTLTRTIRLVF